MKILITIIIIVIRMIIIIIIIIIIKSTAIIISNYFHNLFSGILRFKVFIIIGLGFLFLVCI